MLLTGVPFCSRSWIELYSVWRKPNSVLWTTKLCLRELYSQQDVRRYPYRSGKGSRSQDDPQKLCKFWTANVCLMNFTLIGHSAKTRMKFYFNYIYIPHILGMWSFWRAMFSIYNTITQTGCSKFKSFKK